eukprot:scaffold6055_cov99-Skeletonema_marinoi.AAC.1
MKSSSSSVSSGNSTPSSPPPPLSTFESLYNDNPTTTWHLRSAYVPATPHEQQLLQSLGNSSSSSAVDNTNNGSNKANSIMSGINMAQNSEVRVCHSLKRIAEILCLSERRKGRKFIGLSNNSSLRNNNNTNNYRNNSVTMIESSSEEEDDELEVFEAESSWQDLLQHDNQLNMIGWDIRCKVDIDRSGKSVVIMTAKEVICIVI